MKMNPLDHQRKENNAKNIGVYAFISPSGKAYVGMTSDSFETRWNNHYKKLKNNRHHCPGLQYAFNKYGWDKLERVILEEYVKPSDPIIAASLN